MDALIIHGPSRLSGNVLVSGSKNAALPLLFSSILFSKRVIFRNVPRLWDIETTLKLLESMGAQSHWDKENGTVSILSNLHTPTASYEWVKKMRAGVLALGPLLGKYKQAKVSLPGGCAIGARPVDFHISALQKLGAEISIEEGYIHARAPRGLRGSEIYFPCVTVTGTENLMLAACCAQGTTIIKNAALEPEVIALGQFLISRGAKISGLGTSQLVIKESNLIESDEPASIPSDRIETGTWFSVAVSTRSALTLENVDLSTLTEVVNVYEAMGVRFEAIPEKQQLRIMPPTALNPVDIETHPYPGFPTDMQAQVMANLCLANGKSVIRETIFENRFMHVAELSRLGAQIKIHGNEAIITGPTTLKGAPLMATDLRASASLVVAGLAAEGSTRVSRIYHLDRGYQKLDLKLRQLGAHIERVQE